MQRSRVSAFFQNSDRCFYGRAPGRNETLSRATAIGIDGSNRIVRNFDPTDPISTVIGSIGDSLVSGEAERDIDFVVMNLERGATVGLTASATLVGSPLDPYLRIFNSLVKNFSRTTIR